jgi:hypothetical protein
MPATIAGAPANAPSSAQNTPALLVPFTRAATEHTESFVDISTQMTTSTVAIAPQDIPAYGYMRGIFLEVTTTLSAGASVFGADGPEVVLQDISVNDVNGAPIVGPINGYDARLMQLLGGYRKLRDTRLQKNFKASATDGSITFLLYIPVEVNQRDALGALGNMNAASSYKLRYSIAPSTTVYTTVPTTLPLVRVRAWLDAWTQPTDVNLQGQPQATQPPAHGTTSYWSKTTFNVAAGQNTLRLPRVGNYIRQLILQFRDTTGARNESLIPTPTYFNWDTRLLHERQPNPWLEIMENRYGLNGAFDAAGAVPTGVRTEDFMHEFDGSAGLELRDGWLPTSQSTRLEFVGSFGAAGTLTVLTNDVSPVGDVFV